MEKWKIATIAALLLSLLGFGIYQQNADQNPTSAPAPSGTPLPSPYVGKMLPVWNFKTWNSKPVPLASLKGKPAFIEIFRTDCPHCQDAAPFMVALDKRYGPRGLKMVSIQSPGNFKDPENPENKWPDVLAWVRSYGIKTPVAFDKGSEYFQGTITKQILGGDTDKVRYPMMMWLDKSGKVDFAQSGHDLGKAITLAIEFEKRFPTSPDPAKNAADLLPWLNQHLPGLQAEGALSQALKDDIAQRLKSG